MNKREKIFLIIGITAIAFIFIILSVEDRMLGFAGIIGIFLLSILIADPRIPEPKIKQERRKKTSLEVKFWSLSIQESMSVLLLLLVCLSLLFLGASEANMRVCFPSGKTEKR